MKFFRTPNISSEVNMKLEDSLNLLLASIALEENSLSKLLDVEKEKALYCFEEYKLNKLSLQDVHDIVEHLNQTISNMVRLQMLLDNKLHSIIEVLPTISTSSTTTTTTTSTTTTTTTTTTDYLDCYGW